MGVAAAILAFGLTPIPKYADALRELRVLRQLSLKDCDKFAAALVPKVSGAATREYVAALRRSGYPTPSDTFFAPQQV